MSIAIGIVVLILGLICWLGQSLVFLKPGAAIKLGFLEPEEGIDPAMRIIEGRAEALVDMLLAWTLPAAGLLLVLDHRLWPWLGLFGSGVYLYFSGLIIFTRVFLKRAGRQIGSPGSVRGAYIFGSLWALSALLMLILSLAELTG